MAGRRRALAAPAGNSDVRWRGAVAIRVLAHDARDPDAALAHACALIERGTARALPNEARPHRGGALSWPVHACGSRHRVATDAGRFRRHAVTPGERRTQGGDVRRRATADHHAGNEPRRHGESDRAPGVRRGRWNARAGESPATVRWPRERGGSDRGLRSGASMTAAAAVALLSGGLDSTT